MPGFCRDHVHPRRARARSPLGLRTFTVGLPGNICRIPHLGCISPTSPTQPAHCRGCRTHTGSAGRTSAMRSLRLVQKLASRRLQDATDAYLRELATAPQQASEAHTKRVLAELAESPGPHVYLGETPSGLKVRVPLAFLIRACCITTGGTGAGKTMAALLPLEAIVRRLPGLKTIGFGVLDAKGELFDRAVYLLAARLAELRGRERQELFERIVIVDFANRVSLFSVQHSRALELRRTRL